MRVLIRAISTIMKMKIKFSWAKKKKTKQKALAKSFTSDKVFQIRDCPYEILIIY